jgi:hypothetical protein
LEEGIDMKKEFNFFDKPGNIKKLNIFFYATLGILVVLDFFIVKHPHFGWDKIPCTYALYGFLSCGVIIAISKILGKLWLQKGEDYYD